MPSPIHRLITQMSSKNNKNLSDLKLLANLIGEKVEEIERAYEKAGASFPSLDDPIDLASSPPQVDCQETINVTIAAAVQLAATLRDPGMTLMMAAGGQHLTAVIGIAEGLHIAEILRNVGPEGLHFKEIARIAGADEAKTGRALRFLATSHIFREVKPNHFLNNRSSSLLDSGFDIEELKRIPLEKKYSRESAGVAAVIGHQSDEVFKATTMSRDMAILPGPAGQAVKDSPFYKVNQKDLFQFYKENPMHHARFSSAMQGAIKMWSNTIVEDYAWGSLPPGSLIVDVGGGIGSTTALVAEAHPQFKYIVQDLPETIETAAKEFWQSRKEKDIVQLEVGDFFKPQPAREQAVAVYLLKFIIHDWPTELSRTILRNLHDASSKDTKLVVVDNIIPYAADSLATGIPGADAPSPPPPLLANLGSVSYPAFYADMAMMVACNSQERTISDFVDLVDGLGWKLNSVKRSSKSTMATVVFDYLEV